MKRTRQVGIQYAALPYRLQGRRLWILLISSRRTRRWVIPKGWPIKGRKPAEVASQEGQGDAPQPEADPLFRRAEVRSGRGG